MAQATAKSVMYAGHSKVRRPGIHAKSKTSGLKSSKNYKKAYAGQGRI